MMVKPKYIQTLGTNPCMDSFTFTLREYWIVKLSAKNNFLHNLRIGKLRTMLESKRQPKKYWYQRKEIFLARLEPTKKARYTIQELLGPIENSSTQDDIKT